MMMNILKGLATTTLLLSSLFFASCEKSGICISGEGSIETRTINVASFSEVDLVEAGNVIISQGAVQKVVVTGHPNIIDRLKTNVDGNRWDIDLENGCYKDYDLTVNITVPNIKNVALSGSGNITVNNFESQGNLAVSIPGSGDIKLYEFNGTQNLDMKISGSGNITANNLLPNLVNTNIVISGSGNINAFPIITKNSDVLISGSGNVEVGVSDLLDVVISGSGKIYYKGYPVIYSKITGSGNIVNSN